MCKPLVHFLGSPLSFLIITEAGVEGESRATSSWDDTPVVVHIPL